jgi:hypothetical protein
LRKEKKKRELYYTAEPRVVTRVLINRAISKSKDSKEVLSVHFLTR